MTCGAPLAVCTTDDVTRGLAQVSEQFSNFSGYVVIYSILIAFVLVLLLVLTFAQGRR
jgi:hypothetical protein